MRESSNSREFLMPKKVIVVDLDGTLIESDVTWESVLDALIHHPLQTLWILVTTLGNLKALKEALVTRFGDALAPEFLPYNLGVLDALRVLKRKGHHLVLATASHKVPANKIAAHVGLFDHVLASDSSVNLKAESKAKALVKAFGRHQFTYWGNSRDDLPVWKVAEKAVCVNCSPALFNRVEAQEKELFSERPNRLKESVRLLRLYQWVKNTLLFLPLLAAHRFFEVDLVLKALGGFLSFSLVASALYVVNDLVDIDHDRRHPRKRQRPLAKGALQVIEAFALFGGTLLCGLGLALWVGGSGFLGLILLYGSMSFFYSVCLKKVPLLDVLVLAFLFVLRLLAGHLVTQVTLTHWFILFFGFLFLSLALVKRYAEFKNTAQTSLSGRGYVAEDVPLIQSLGLASALMSLVVLGLYLNSPEVAFLYAHPAYLWLTLPLIFYAVADIWLCAGRGTLHDDPLLFIFKSPRFYWLGAGVLCCAVLAKL